MQIVIKEEVSMCTRLIQVQIVNTDSLAGTKE